FEKHHSLAEVALVYRRQLLPRSAPELDRERAIGHANPLEILGRSAFARQRSVPREYALVSFLDPLEVHMLTGSVKRVMGQLRQTLDDLVEVAQRLLQKADDTEAGCLRCEVAVVHGGHQKSRYTVEVRPEPADGLEAVDAR